MSAFPYIAHGVTLSLAWFVIVNVAASILVAVAARQLLRAIPVGAPSLWLTLRLLPSIAAIVFVSIVFVPSYWRYEPREFVEGFDLTLTSCAVAALAIVTAACARALSAARGARRRVESWMRGARRIGRAAESLPIYEIDADQPVIALSGLFRHRLLMTRGFVEALSSSEVAASVAHEIGHRRAFDNLKRLAMRAAPDVLAWTGAARALERRWASAAEHAADGMAGEGAAARCALASALVKVARLTPPDRRWPGAAEPISTLIGGGEIASRVQRLLDDTQPTTSPRCAPLGLAAALACALPLVVAYTPLLRAVHEATEILVRALP